ncbi:MAG: hypothetical protein Kow0077_09260 [Anaerolineae bacterium]
MAGNTSKLNRLTRDIVVLADIAKLLNTLDQDAILNHTLSVLTSTVDAENGTFIVFKPGAQTAERFLVRKNLPAERSQIVVEQVLETGLAGWVYRNKTSALIADTQEDSRWIDVPDSPNPARSVLCVPLLAENEVLGIMTLEHSEPNHFKTSDVRLATIIANLAAVSLHNAHLYTRLENQQNQLQALLQSTQQPIITIDPAGKIQLINQTALQLTGLSETDLIGHSLASINQFPMFAIVATGIVAGQSRLELHDDQSDRDFIVQISSWRDGEKHDLGYVIAFQDVTVLKEMNRRVTQMLHVVSHDLKNPLAIISGYAELMLMEMDPSDQFYTHAADIARVAQRMYEMITQFLDLERIRTYEEIDSRSFDPIALLDDVLYDMQPLITTKKQMLHRIIPEDCPSLQGDAAQIRECIKNLVENAHKYTPEGGEITVQVQIEEEAQRFTLAVIDTGIGIPAQHQPHIFERFYRAKQPGAENIPGTGLGLSLVKAIIERHGGEVWFTSTPGQGSTFGFWLPLQRTPDKSD